MGRKVNPIGYRLGINKTWEGRWYAEGKEYVDQLHKDFALRDLVRAEAAKPGVLIGRKGESVKKLRQQLEAMVGKKIDLEIKEIKAPDLDAFLVSTNIAEQLERRISYQRAMKRAIQQAMRQGALGIRVEVGGRLSGAEMARVVNMREGRVPRATLRADIDYHQTEALTTYGRIGVKVWIYRGDVLPALEEQVESTEGVYVSE
jgi:small subunit ribosomal protein S3